MKLTDDESRALAFIAGLLLLSAAVRVGAAREPVAVPAGAAGFDLAEHIEGTRTAVAEAERAARPLGPGERLDPNTADAVELDRLPRVGPALAARIVRERERNGPFRSAADLTRVRGVGARAVEEMVPHLALPRDAPAGRAGRARATARGERPDDRPVAAGGRNRGEPRQPREAPESGARDPGGPSVVDVNRADQAALATLPGIGPVLAARIIAHRDSAGPFRDVEALTAVRGIGPATVSRLKGLVRVHP